VVLFLQLSLSSCVVRKLVQVVTVLLPACSRTIRARIHSIPRNEPLCMYRLYNEDEGLSDIYTAEGATVIYSCNSESELYNRLVPVAAYAQCVHTHTHLLTPHPPTPASQTPPSCWSKSSSEPCTSHTAQPSSHRHGSRRWV